MKVKILETTDGKFVEKEVETDLHSIALKEDEVLEITGRFHRGNGLWRLWNSNYVIEAQEVN